jgi:hypothetical protein
MKGDFLRFSIILAPMLFMVGCAHTMRVKVIDAETGQPVAGVEVCWRQDYQDLLLGSHHYGPTNLPSSTTDGLITLDGLHPKDVSRFIFSHPGYRTVYGIYSGGALTLAEATNAAVPPELFILKGKLITVEPNKGVCVVQMAR